MKMLKIILPILMLVVGAVENSFALRRPNGIIDYIATAKRINHNENRAARNNLIDHIDIHLKATRSQGAADSIGKERHTIVNGQYGGRAVLSGVVDLIKRWNEGMNVGGNRLTLTDTDRGRSLTLVCRVRDVIPQMINGAPSVNVAYEFSRGNKLPVAIENNPNEILNSWMECHLHFVDGNGTLNPGDGRGNGNTGSVWITLR